MKATLISRIRRVYSTAASISVSIGSGPFITGTELTAMVSGLEGGESVTYQWTDDGGNITGATSSTYTAAIGTDSVADASAIGVTVTVDGGDPITSGTREIRYAAATGGADLDLGYPEDSAITPQDLLANWTTTNLTMSYVSVSPSLPTGLSINSSGTLSGTPTTITADDTYTLTMEDQYGRETSDTFTLEITASDTTAPTISSSSFTDSTDTLNVTVDEGGTLYWVLDASATPPSKAQVKAGNDQGGAAADASGSFAISAGANSDTADVSGVSSGSYYIYVMVEDASGNQSDVDSTAVTVDNTDPGITSYSPADGATDVATNAPLVITFNESMKTSGTAAVVTVKKVSDDSTVATYDPDTQGTWSTATNTDDRWTAPTPTWTNSDALYVEYSGFEDTSGNTVSAVSGSTTWNFDVIAAAGVTPFASWMPSATSCWTDSVGGTQAGDGDSVTVIEDEQGSNDITFTGTKPILRQAGTGEWYLEATGNEGGSVALNLSDGGEFTLVCGWMADNISNTGIVYEFSSNHNSTAGTFSLYANGTGAGLGAKNTSTGGTGYSGYDTAALSSATGYVTSHVIDFYGNTRDTESIEIRVNGADAKNSPGGIYSNNDVNGANNTFYLFARASSSLRFDGRFYGLELHKAALSGSDLTAAESNISANTE